ncbi:MAG: ThiF family adenylyltransferase [Cyclobacteriaceae bacterium]|nr:ThiF family adenylyltransferase [Cyclobacteriaceae bacterium]
MDATGKDDRYARHLILPGFGKEGQEKLRHASVAVIGAGGLGAPVIAYLTAAGVGTLGIFDPDTVALSNLQRQVLFTTDDIGQPKATCAERAARRLNPTVWVSAMAEEVTSANALTFLAPYDVIVDATDNFPTRYLVNDACAILGKPWVYGSIFRYEGQVSVFNWQGGTTYRDLYPEPPKPGAVPDCEDGGVLGVLPGVIGSLQANEVIKLIAGIGEPLSGKLLLFDSLTLESRIIRLSKRHHEPIHHLIDYDHFCGVSVAKGMKEVTVEELKALLDKKADIQLIDVREPHEYDTCNLGGELIPMAEVPFNIDRISKDKQVIIHCRSGGRSGNIINWLEKNHGFTNLYNLKGGILDWAKKVDPSMPTY